MHTFVRILKIIFTVLTIVLLVLPYLNPVIAGYLVYVGYFAIPIFVIDFILVFIPDRKSHHHHSHHHHSSRHHYWRYAYIIVPICCLYTILPISRICNLFMSANDKASSFKVVSWNVDNYSLSKSKLSESSQYIRNLNPDVICLQERPHTNLMSWSSVQKQFPEYKYSVKNTREDEVLNLAVFSKYPISKVREYYYPHSYNKTMRVDLRIGTKTLRLFNVHLQTTGVGYGNADERHNVISRINLNAVKRNFQADQIVEAIARSPYPVVVCGDLNDVETGYPYRNLARHLNDINTVFNPQGSYQKLGGLARIDYILVGKKIKGLYYELIGNQWSDHKIQIGMISM